MRAPGLFPRIDQPECETILVGPEVTRLERSVMAGLASRVLPSLRHKLRGMRRPQTTTLQRFFKIALVTVAIFKNVKHVVVWTRALLPDRNVSHDLSGTQAKWLAEFVEPVVRFRTASHFAPNRSHFVSSPTNPPTVNSRCFRSAGCPLTSKYAKQVDTTYRLESWRLNHPLVTVETPRQVCRNQVRLCLPVKSIAAILGVAYGVTGTYSFRLLIAIAIVMWPSAYANAAAGSRCSLAPHPFRSGTSWHKGCALNFRRSRKTESISLDTRKRALRFHRVLSSGMLHRCV